MGAELPRGAQMGKLGLSGPFSNLFVWQPNSQRQLACLSPPGPRPPPFPHEMGEADELLSHPAFHLYGGLGGE